MRNICTNKECNSLDATTLSEKYKNKCEELLPDSQNVKELEMISKMYCDWMRNHNNTYLEYYSNCPDVSYIYSRLIEI